MDDSLTKDQLSLWQHLNRLYGEGQKAKEPSQDQEGPGGETSPEAAAAGQETRKAGSEETSAVSRVCADCEYDCRQPADNFVIARCRIAEKQKLAETGTRAVFTSRSSMGFEKVNETCRGCRKSCKQFSKKLNRMLCLGFEPINE